MKTNLMIKQMAVSDDFEGFYILKSPQSKTSTNGKPYLSAALADGSGEIQAKMWDYAGPIGQAENGKIVKVRGSVSEFKGALQATISQIRLARDDDPVDISALVPTAPIDAEAEYENVRRIIATIQDTDYRRICEELLSRHGEAFKNIPAGKSVHHKGIHGNLMHTGTMLKAMEAMAALYSDVVNRDLSLAAAFAHDLNKDREFALSELGLVADYSLKGQLIGHSVLGAEEVAEIAAELNVPEEKSVLLQHLILSHHGEPEYGAAVRPMCAEAALLNYIDMIDSRMDMFRDAYANLKPGEFSERNRFLGTNVYRPL